VELKSLIVVASALPLFATTEEQTPPMWRILVPMRYNVGRRIPDNKHLEANTPNWDIVSKCEIGGKRGLILVEAKAHTEESKIAGKGADKVENDCRIGAAISEANSALNSVLPRWALTKVSHYQLCNRFAWAWKLGAMGFRRFSSIWAFSIVTR